MSHLTDDQIALLRKNYNPKIGPRNADEWMFCSTDSPNPLNNVAAANAYLGHVLSESLNIQKDIVQQVTKLIDGINDVKTDLERYRPAKPEATDGKLGSTFEEAKDLVKRLKAAGVEFTPEQQKKIDDAFAKKEVPSGFPATAWTPWATALQGRSESLTAQTEQETLRLQTFTNRYTQANDQSSSVQTKDFQSRSTYTRNIGG